VPRYEPEPSNHRVLAGTSRARGPGLEEIGHERLRDDLLSGWFDLEIVTVDAVHVGSGTSSEFDGRQGAELGRDIVQAVRNGQSVPVIPGASLKGAIRSIAETLGGGCDQDQKYCDPPCRTCSLFGHLMKVGGFLGRVGFGDAFPVGQAEFGVTRLPVAFQPRKAEGRRIYGVPSTTRSGPVPYWVIVAGSCFSCRMTLTNVSEREMGLVLLSAGADGTFRLRIGGGKFAGLGRVKVSVAAGWLRRGYDIPAERLDASAARQCVEQSIRAFPVSAETARVLETLRSVMR